MLQPQKNKGDSNKTTIVRGNTHPLAHQEPPSGNYGFITCQHILLVFPSLRSSFRSNIFFKHWYPRWSSRLLGCKPNSLQRLLSKSQRTALRNFTAHFDGAVVSNLRGARWSMVELLSIEMEQSIWNGRFKTAETCNTPTTKPVTMKLSFDQPSILQAPYLLFTQVNR